MKKIIFIILIIILIIGVFILISNNNKTHIVNKNNKIKDKFTDEIMVTINNKNYTLKLEDNNTTRELFKDLPFDFDMKELNGNEKYFYLDKNYPTHSLNPKHINKGDVMLYGDNCLVIFYKSFDTSYSYTKIGYIDNLEEINNGNVNVRFSIK